MQLAKIGNLILKKNVFKKPRQDTSLSVSNGTTVNSEKSSDKQMWEETISYLENEVRVKEQVILFKKSKKSDNCFLLF